MPRSKSGLKRRPVSEENLISAAKMCTSGEMSMRKAAQLFNVSKTTLERHVRSFKKLNATEFTYIANNNTKQVFTAKEEELLKNYLNTAARLRYGLTKNEVRTLAYHYSIANEKVIPNNWTLHKIAGKEWLRQFLKRHPDLSLGKPEATGPARTTTFNKCNITNFFTNYKQFLSRYNLTSDKIWNCAETEVTTVHIAPKIIGPKGTKQLLQMTSDDCGQNVTVIVAINARGNHLPPMMIFPTVHFKSHMLKRCPAGTVGDANPNGWSDSSLFIKFLKHFQNHTKPTVEEPVILLLDNNDRYISIEAIDFCLVNGIILLTFPPQTTHRLQPLGRTVFGPLKSFYNTACIEWMLKHPGKSVTIYNVAELIGKAFPEALTFSNILKGFVITGIYPVNENMVDVEEFLPSYAPDCCLSESSMINLTGTQTTINNERGSASTSKAVITPDQLRPFPEDFVGTDAYNVP